jgi:hypothetical protein
MAAIARPGVCKNRDRPMSQKLSAAASSIASGKVRAPVRVKLRRKNSEQAIPYPPDGQARDLPEVVWLKRTKRDGEEIVGAVKWSEDNCGGTVQPATEEIECGQFFRNLEEYRKAGGTGGGGLSGAT